MKKSISKIVTLLLCCIMLVSVVACGGGNSNNTNSATTDNNAGGSSDTGSTNTGSGGSNAGGGSNTGGGNTGSASTGGGNVTSATSSKDTVTIAITQDSGDLDPANSDGMDIIGAIRMIYDTLWEYTIDGEIVWKLATGYEIIDPLRWRIFLREGIKFSNGNDFDAEDVLFSMQKVQYRPGQPGVFLQFVPEESKAIDKYTVEVVFNEFLVTLESSCGGLCMHDKETADADPLQPQYAPMGTGPYVMTDYVVNSHMTLERRDDYWGDLPAIKYFNFVQLKEASQRVSALQIGEVDVIQIPFQDVEYVDSMPEVNVRLTPSGRGTAIYFNVSQYSVFYNNPDARRAVAYAVDRDAILRLVYNNYGVLSRAPAPYGLVQDVDDKTLDMGIYGEKYNPTLAKEYAEKAGLFDKSIKLINNGSSEAVLTCELVQAYCDDIGVTVEVNTLDMGTWTTVLFDETQFDMCIDGTRASSGTLCSGFNFAYNYMGGTSYLSTDFPGKKEAFAYIDLPIMSVGDFDQRVKMNYDLTKIAVDEMLWLSMVDIDNTYGFAAGLEGQVIDQNGLYRRWRNLYWE